VDPAFAAQATVNVYLNTDKSNYQGTLVGTGVLAAGSQPNEFTVTANIDPATLGLNPLATYYLYFTLNDGLHPVALSDFSAAIVFPDPPLSGTLTETGDGRNQLLAGFNIYIDQNGNGQFDPGEPSTTTNAQGNYSFYDNPANNLTFTSGSAYAVGVQVPPSGYQLPPGASATTTFTYNGSPATIDLQLQQQITISGIVFNNVDGKGAPPSQDANDVGVPGVTVFLDESGTGVLTASDPQTNTLSDGSYQFVGLSPSTAYVVDYVLPGGFLVSGSAPTTYNVPVGTDPLAIYGGNDFAVVGAGVISGTVLGNGISAGKLGNPMPESGWTVKITNNRNNVSSSTTTDSSGAYQFPNLTPGTYTVTQQVPPGWQQVAPFSIDPSLNPTFLRTEEPIGPVASADFNNDGNLDLAVAPQGKNEIDYSHGNGNGTFASAQKIAGLPLPTGASFSSVEDLETGDFNGDGYTDLIALVSFTSISGNNAEVVALLGSASGFGTPMIAYSPPPTSVSPQSSTLVDGIATGGSFFANSTNTDDFVIYGITTTTFNGIPETAYFLQTIQYSPTNNSFQAGEQLIIPSAFGPVTPAPSLHAVAIGDLNNDGAVDLFINFGTASQNSTSPVAWVAYGQGNGTFGRFLDGSAFGTVNAPDLSIPLPFNGGPVALGDLNGDGILDAVTLGTETTSSPQPQAVNVIEQTSVGTWYDLNGNFSSSNNYTLPFNAIFGDKAQGGRDFLVPQVAIADINGDGLPDIVLVEPSTDSNLGQTLTYFNLGNTLTDISIFNDSTSTNYLFTTLPKDNQGKNAQPDSMVLGDFNNDGQIDVVLGEPTSSGGGEWYLSNQSQVAQTTFTVAPNGQYLVNFVDLQLGQVGGAVFADPNGNNKFDVGEKGLAGIAVFVDLNNNGKLDPGEPVTKTNAQGFYAFQGLSPITNASIRVLDSALLNQRSSPHKSAPLDLSLAAGNSLDFAIAPTLVQTIADQTIVVGSSVSVPVLLAPGVKQNDPKRPGKLVFTLDNSAPAGLTINPETGLLSWTPTSSQLGTFPITVRVRDTQNPLDDDSTTFNLTVQPPIVVVAGGAISGVVFGDLNADGVKSATDLGIGGQVVYLDANNNGKLDFGETSTVTAVDGSYSFTNLNPGGYVVRELLPNGASLQTTPVGGKFEVAVPSGTAETGLDFGNITTSTFVSVTPQQTIFPAGETGFTAYVNGVYRNLLARNADPTGQSFWVGALNAGMSRQEMALGVLQSPEYRGIEVDSYYRTFLNRAESEADRSFWVNAMVGGLSEEMVTFTFLTSAEYQNLHSSNSDFVGSLYRNVLSRQPDSALGFWTNAIVTGESRASVVQSFSAPVLTSPTAVDAFYSAFLHRAPDAGGATFWQNFLEQGGAFDSVAAAILGSDEYFGNIRQA
jgi:hypothetical protein